MLNVPVLILFFIRPSCLQMVFDRVRECKPKKLYLYQDGARSSHPGDWEKILACRKIVESIDWDCEVHQLYSNENLGCDAATVRAIDWVLETEDCVIRLEDDNLPAYTFFEFCSDALEKYRTNKQVMFVSGRNQMGQFANNTGDVIFTQLFSSLGFAIWKDRWEMVDTDYRFLSDNAIMQELKKNAHNKYEISHFIETCKKHKELTERNGKPYSYESAIRAAMLVNNALGCIHCTNMIENVGVCGDAVHSAASRDSIPEADRWTVDLVANEIEFPIKYPEYICENIDFYNKRIMQLHQYSWLDTFKHKMRCRMRHLKQKLHKS